MNVIAAEMEASLIFVLARVWGLRAGGVSVVLDNMLEVTGETGNFDPGADIEHGVDHIERLARIGNEAVRLLHEADTAAAR